MRTFNKAIIAAAAGAVVVLSASVASAAEPSGARSIGGVSVDVPGISTSTQLEAFLDSGRPKTVEVDPATGDVLSVSAGEDRTVTDLPVGSDSCTEGDVCLYGVIGSHPGYGFSGAGSVHGSWEDRIGYTSGSYDVEVTLDNGVVIEAFGPNTAVGFFDPQTITDLTLENAAA